MIKFIKSIFGLKTKPRSNYFVLEIFSECFGELVMRELKGFSKYQRWQGEESLSLSDSLNNLDITLETTYEDPPRQSQCELLQQIRLRINELYPQWIKMLGETHRDFDEKYDVSNAENDFSMVGIKIELEKNKVIRWEAQFVAREEIDPDHTYAVIMENFQYIDVMVCG